MTKETFVRFDGADEPRTEAHMRGYLDACLEDGSPRLIDAALGDIACARETGKAGRELRKP